MGSEMESERKGEVRSGQSETTPDPTDTLRHRDGLFDSGTGSCPFTTSPTRTSAHGVEGESVSSSVRTSPLQCLPGPVVSPDG